MEKDWKDRVQPAAKRRPTVMVIDDDRAQLCEYANELWLREFDVVAVHVKTGAVGDQKPRYGIPLYEVKAVRDVLSLAGQHKPDCILSDWNLGWGNDTGDQLLGELGFDVPDAVRAMHSLQFKAHEKGDGYDCFPKRQGLADLADYFHERLAQKGRAFP